MKQIGISLTENGMMKPHASVCGLMFAHPASRYFSIGKIGEDQLADYAARRGMSIEETKSFSPPIYKKRINYDADKVISVFLLLLILPDMYIYKAYIRRVSQKWTHWAYWLPSLFLLLGMTLVFSIHEPRPDSMQRLSNFLLIFLCFSVPKALFVIVILFMKLLYIISGKNCMEDM